MVLLASLELARGGRNGEAGCPPEAVCPWPRAGQASAGLDLRDRLLLQPDPARRREGAAQRDAIRLLEPRLMKFPINPLPMSERLKRDARSMIGPRIARKLRSFKNLLKPNHAR